MTTPIRELDQLDMAAALLASDHRIIMANAAMADALGVTTLSLRGVDINDALAATTAEQPEAGSSNVYRLASDRAPAWCRLDLKAVDGGFVAIMTDVSEEYRSLEEIRNFYALRDRLLLDGKIGTWRFDPDADVYHFSSELALGHEGATAPIPVALLQLIQHPDDREKDTAIRERITHHGGFANAEMRYREGNGQWTHLNVHYRAGRQTPSGRFEMFGISQNITGVAMARDEAAQLSERLASALHDAEYANRSKTEFLANMSHELRTPLNAILGFSQMIERQMFGSVGAKYVEYANDIHRSGEHLLELINDVLDLSKLEAGKLELHNSEISLPALVDDCLTLVRGRADDADIRLETELSPTVPSLRADARAIKQVLLNFLSNAVKFTPEGGIVTVRSNQDAGGGVCLSVIDTGIGMSEADIEVALSPFGQIDSKLARKSEGTGLGLSICKSLIELHGGTLTVASVPNKGTTMSATFPAGRTTIRTNAA